MKTILSTTMLASALVLAIYGLAGAQGAASGQNGNASGGLLAQNQTQNQAPGQAGAPAAQVAMTEEQIRNMLKTRGYSDLSGIERDGDSFKVSEAKRYGKSVENLRVNARTGMIRDDPQLTEDQAKKLLGERGYSDVSDVKRDGDIITGKAKRDGQAVQLRIDTRTGLVTPQAS